MVVDANRVHICDIRAQAVSYAFLLSCAVPFIRPRLPLPKKQTRDELHILQRLRQRNRIEVDTSPSSEDNRGNTKWACLRRRAFWLLFSGVLLQGLGGFVPGTYLPCESVFPPYQTANVLIERA